MEIEDLIVEMQAVKQAHPNLENQEILRIFGIRATMNLTNQMRRIANNG